ncbi:MAG: choice-of-anchor Q domain-containing protein, partial [Planctomycetota bacterium]
GSGAPKLAGSPRFVDPAAGDYRLRQDSPCVDTGQVATSALDNSGQPRVVDGDYDLVPAPDMGAFEHRTLQAPPSVRFDEPFDVHVSGPVGAFSTLVVNHSGFAPVGSTTPFGRLFLASSGSYRLTPVMTDGGRPTAVTIPAFDDPALIGTSTGLQALTRSVLAPAGGAFSQPALVEIQ